MVHVMTLMQWCGGLVVVSVSGLGLGLDLASIRGHGQGKVTDEVFLSTGGPPMHEI